MKALIILLAATIPALAIYTYTTTDTLTSANSTTWQANGSPNYTSSGLNSSSAASLIYKLTVPGNANEYEVAARLSLTANSGSYYLYLRASQDTHTDGSTATGSFYAFEVSNPVFVSGACTATLNAWKRASGTVTQLGSTTMPCKDGMIIHAVANSSGQFWFYADGLFYLNFNDTTLTTGQPGIGIRGTTANSISLAQVGPRDTVAPTAVPNTAVSTNINWRSVEMQWQGAADDANGIGIWGYQIYRDGTYLHTQRDSTFVDDTLQPQTNYTYTIYAIDWHFNWSSVTTAVIHTPPLYQGDLWRTGVRANGTYWGGMGEQIDLLSGNLNYTMPLLNAKSRSGGATFNLTYNSQQWRKDTATWKHGVDSGYGWGWKFQAGSLTPMYSDYWTIHHYIFIDSTGTEYYLDVNYGGTWKASTAAFYGEYDPATKRLYFPDGSFWEFDSLAAGSEQDAGTAYPTKMQDTNGNYISIRYKAGLGTYWTNSSSRIDEIEDVRATTNCAVSGTYASFKFTYNTDAIPHLTGIYDCYGGGLNLQFGYNSATSLVDPWNTTTYGSTNALHHFTNQVSETTSFEYTSALELSKVNTPYGGYLRWEYSDYTLIPGIKREVNHRYWSTGGGATEQHYTIYHPSNDSGNNVHSSTAVQDASAAADKVYFFYGNGFLSTIYERQLSPTGDKRIVSPGYSTDAIGRPYISSTTTIIDPGTSNAQTQKTEQTLDVYGNLVTLKQYHYAAGSATPTLARTYTYSYVNSSNYTNLHIYNRVAGVTVQKPGGSVIALATNTYDVNIGGSTITGARQWDSTVGNYRGNLTKSITPGATKNISYSNIGTVNSADDNNGHSVSVTMDASANYAAPSAVTTGSLSNSFTWNSFLGLTQSTAPNSAISTQTYDSYSRPTQSTEATGQAAAYSYTATTRTSTTGSRWTRTTVDGLGRTSKVETGYGTGGSAVTVAVVDTLYTPCACSPMGKVWKVSLPHAPGASTVYSTEYVYDALGRTIQVKQPNNSGTATYSYAGNTVTSTDAAGKWKLFESDAMGNLTKVTEPNPAGGANYETTYAYSELGQLLTVTMSRGSNTQTRTFVYDSDQRLYTVTNPENGTTTHFYNADGTLAYKTDAKGQKITYTYDSLRRVTAVRRYVNSTSEDTNQRTDFEYDGNSGIRLLPKRKWARGRGDFPCLRNQRPNHFLRNVQLRLRGPCDQEAAARLPQWPYSGCRPRIFLQRLAVELREVPGCHNSLYLHV